ncbi:alpha/beta hydrolase [Actinocorallia sp. API 0066]|uniref:alpha/beta fold hydrolase n=1 Tax=Actinocorallia sp. API 0066 TaxID=2896846 RepID=UPI001E362DB7|nr:alpha/beta hydrolase [Actinocorallia sp. API 0066]MCD0452092.1 alpha/beta hydrolase [Actinocorallia sp. API 0066]
MLAHERRGEGEPLVLLHGITHRRQAWYPVADHLAEHHEVILIDLPGHGESPSLRPGYQAPGDRMLDQLIEGLADLGLDRPHIAANSLGGGLALELAARDAVRSVTAFSPIGFWRGPLDFRYTTSLFRVILALSGRIDPYAERLLRTRVGRAALFSWINTRPGTLTPEQALGDFRGLLRARPEVMEFLAETVPFTAPPTGDVPVTIAWAQRDIVLPVYQAKIARTCFPWAKHVVLPGCGHVPMNDDPYRVATTILRGTRAVLDKAAA